MKKLTILLVAAYVGVLAYEYYRKIQTNKIWNDEKWQYCMKVLYNNNFKEPSDTFLFKWKDDFRILIFGMATKEDKKSLKKTVAQFNELIYPSKITLYIEPSPKELSKINPNIYICLKTKNKYCPCHLMHDTISGISFRNNWTTKTTMRNSVTTYKPNSAWLNITVDSSEQTKRNQLILKGLTYILLCFDQPRNEWVDHFDANGHSKCRQVNDPHFPTSIFNSNCTNCYELADVDKYIIKTYYSQKIEKTIAAYSPYNYLKKSSKFIYIETAIVIAILLTLYFFGYFQRTIFTFFDNRIRAKWLAFNCKVLFIVLLFSILYVITDLLTYYGFASGVVSKLVSFGPYSLIFFWSHHLKFWIGYILIPINCIYLIEKVWFSKFEQFAKQQLFSFILLVAGTLLTMYLLKKSGQRDFPFHLGNYWISLCIGAGIGVIRFLYNYSNYQKKLAFIEKEQELTQLRELKTRAELNALQSKINPHFLYNALNSIAGLAHENADKVEQMALALSKLFRYSINKEDDDFTNVQNEVEMVSIYLDIEKVRFGDKLQYQVTLPKELEKERIPKFIIQPLVENAIKHGISQITSAGLLTLEISKSDTSLKIMVSDNGPDFPEDLMTGYGLQNIYEKLDILYPGRYEVTLQNGRNKNISVILKTEHEGTKTQ